MIAFMMRGGTAIAHTSKTDAIAFFRFSRKAIAFSSHTTQVKAIASLSYSEEPSIAWRISLYY
jgi:hypothetical protein